MQILLPQYGFLEIIGRGGMGAVYKAVQLTLDRPVAIKVLPGDLMDDSDMDFAERFKNEARTMARMNHPGIVNVFDFGEAPGGLLYIVMEYIDGTDVAKMIVSQGRLPPDYALAILAHVCDALDYAHRHGIVHRDIKPANIMLNKQGMVKVADFGLAKANDNGQTGLTKSNVAMGTPDYVSPEALIAGIPLDGRADIYAMGVMLYQMLTGAVPRGIWTMPSKLIQTDPRFDSIIAKAMQTDREARYPSTMDLRKDLDVIITTPQAKTASSSGPSVQQKPVARGPRKPGESSLGTPAQQKPQTQSRVTRLSAGPSGSSIPVKGPGKGNFAATILGGGLVLGLGAFFLLSGGKPQTSPDSTEGGSSASDSGTGASTAPAAASSNNSGAPQSSKPANASVDLLALVDLDRDVIAGTWSRVKDGLAVKSAGTATDGMPRLQFTAEPPEEYNIDAEFTPTGGDQTIAFNLWAVKKQARFTLNRVMNGRNWSGFERISNKSVEQDNNASFLRPRPLPNGQRQRVHIEVRRNALRGYLNDELIAQWNGDFNSFGLTKDEKLNDDRRVGIAAYNRAVTFHRVSMRPDSGNKPNDVFYFAGHRYQYVSSSENWTRARDRAQAMNGHLATIESAAEDAFLDSSYRYRLSRERDFAFIGGSSGGNSPWRWVTGESFDYRPPGFTARSGSRVLSLEKRGSRLKWNDQDSGARPVGFIVETDGHGGGNLTPAALSGAIDLLTDANVTRGAAKGRWEMKPDGLHLENGPGPQMLAFYQMPPDDYDFEIEFTITGGNRDLSQILPIGGSTILWKMGFGSGETTPFCFGPNLDGKGANDSVRKEAVIKRERLKIGRRYRSLVEVRKNSLRALLDGEEVLAWSGDLKRLTNEPYFKLLDAAMLGIGGFQSAITFHRAELRPQGAPAGSSARSTSGGTLSAAKPSARKEPFVQADDLSSDPRIAKLQAGYDARYETDAQKPFLAAVAALNQSYVSSGIARARATAQAKGDLDEVKALDAEKAAIENGKGVPEEDAGETSAAVRTLRATYRTVLAKHSAERDAKAAPLLELYLKALDAYAAELIQANKIEEAKRVQALRDRKSR